MNLKLSVNWRPSCPCLTYNVNSLWASDIKWHHKCWVNIDWNNSLLPDGRHQTITWTSADWSWMKFCSIIHLRHNDIMPCIWIPTLSHWGRDKMAAVSQTTLSKAFSWMKMFVPKGPINNSPALVQIMAWRQSGDKPLSEPMMVCLLAHICVTRPQWVKTWTCFLHHWPFFRSLVSSPHKGPVMWSSDIFVVCLNKLQDNQSSCQWPEMPIRPSCDVTLIGDSTAQQQFSTIDKSLRRRN